MRSIPDLSRLTRSNFFWAALGALALGQLMALWLVCSQQVRQAEARQAEVMMQQVALNDCLRQARGATLASCSSRFAEAPPPPREPVSVMAEGLQGGVVPVGFTR